MMTASHHLTADEWHDVGPTPCRVENLGSRAVRYVLSDDAPGADADGHVLAPDGVRAIDIHAVGCRVFARVLPDAAGDEAIVVVSPITLVGAEGASWVPAVETVIEQADTYQEVFPAGAAPHGGYLANTSPPGMDPLWVDPTGATGGTRSAGAMPVYPAADGASAPGAWRIPPTKGAVTIMGPLGATFQAFCG